MVKIMWLNWSLYIGGSVCGTYYIVDFDCFLLMPNDFNDFFFKDYGN